MKVILVPVADRPQCRTALDQALRLADRLSANIVGCHLRPHRIDQTVPRSARPRIRVERPRRSAAKPTKRDAELEHTAAHKLFLSMTSEHGFELVKRPPLAAERTAQWIELVGDLDRLFSIAGPVADMSVVSRPKRKGNGDGQNFMLSALLQPGKPTLVLPQRKLPDVGQRMLIAWDQSADAAHAVSAALPLLTRADAVHICSCGPENRAGPKSSSLARYLRYWGVRATRRSHPGQDPSKEILADFAETGSDLIVMGAYSRSRMREILFGGVTQQILFESSVPVFALHS